MMLRREKDNDGLTMTVTLGVHEVQTIIEALETTCRHNIQDESILRRLRLEFPEALQVITGERYIRIPRR